MERNYYVYVYYRLDTNEPFYVGKGKGNRYKEINDRSSHFKNIVNSTPIAVEIVHDNLTEEQALGIECYLIHELVFEYGFSIDIEGANSNDHYCHLVNMTWGGEGCSKPMSEEQKQERSERYSGEGNPFYGKQHSEETIQRLKEINKGKFIGELNPMFGRHHSEESIQKMIENRRDTNGENNPFYGKQHSEETIQKMSGKNHHSAKAIICITTNEIFDTIREGANKYNCDCSSIIRCCKKKVKSCGKHPITGEKLVWKYLDEYLKEQEQTEVA